MLLAVLLAPLQGVASVYANMGEGDKTMLGTNKAATELCEYAEEMHMQQAADHCKHDMQCSQHCDHCAHCQFFPSAPLALNQIPQNRIDRGTSIAFASHIPLVDIRPPRLS